LFAARQRSATGGVGTLGWSIHCETLRQLNVESGENWILPLVHAISYHRAKRVLPLTGWER